MTGNIFQLFQVIELIGFFLIEEIVKINANFYEKILIGDFTYSGLGGYKLVVLITGNYGS